MKKTFFALVCCMLLLSSCVHQSPFSKKDEYYFQAMGTEAEIVVTIDMEKAKPLYDETVEANSFLEEITSRAERVSLAFTPEEEQQTAPIYGAIEGNFPKTLINSALMWSPDYERFEALGQHYYKSREGEISLAMPKNGIILFSTGNWWEAYDKTMKNRVINIAGPTADRMASATMGMYIASPKIMLDIGFEIPLTTLVQVDEVLMLIEEKDEAMVLQMQVVMKHEAFANSMTVLAKSQYIANLRREGIAFSLADLANLFTSDGVLFKVTDMPLSDEQLSGITEIFTQVLSMTGEGQ